MDEEFYASTLKDALSEIHNVCPDITNTFLFRKDGEVITGDGITPEKTVAHVADSVGSILEKADAIGGVKSITLEGSNGRVHFSCLDDLYLVTVTSAKADMDYVNIITHVLIPTILKLLEKIGPTPLKSDSSSARKSKSTMVKAAEETEVEEHGETLEKGETESFLLGRPVNQLIVENLGGFMIPSNTVRVDSEVLLRWKEFHDDSKIKEVEIETFGGKTMRCLVKPIKDAKYDKKGIIQMPEKIQLDLGIKKGELVRVKPIVE